MFPRAIHQAIRNESIRASFDTQPLFTADQLRTFREEEMKASMHRLADARCAAIAAFMREELVPRIDGGAAMDDETLRKTAMAEGYRAVSASYSEFPGVEEIVLYKGSVPIAGCKLRLF